MKSGSNSEAKRAIGWVRSATHNPESLAGQSGAIQEYARKHGIVLVSEVDMSDQPRHKCNVAELIKRKATVNDFEAVLVTTLDRISRRGAFFMQRIALDLEEAGITLITVLEPRADFSTLNISQMITAKCARDRMNADSARIIRVRRQRITDGSMLYVSRPAFGIDRLYVDHDGRNLHVIRTRTDGSQMQLDPTTKQPVRFFLPGHGYRRQSQERAVLIPGAADAVECVRRIFRQRFVDHLSAIRIAAVLNTEGILSPSGTHWQASAVRRILTNPIYLGTGVACRSSSAYVHGRYDSLGGDVLTSPRRQRRPSSEWITTEHPELRDAFVPADRYEEIRQFQINSMQHRVGP